MASEPRFSRLHRGLLELGELHRRARQLQDERREAIENA